MRTKVGRYLERGDSVLPKWSPLGDRIVYARSLGLADNPREQLFAIRPDGTRRQQLTRDQKIGIDDEIDKVMWVQTGPLKGKRLFYLRAFCT